MDHNMITKRATGRTFRMLNAAIGKASGGINVVVVLHSPHYALDCLRSVYDMVNAYYQGTIERTSKETLMFPNGAYIGFAGAGCNVASVNNYIRRKTDRCIYTLTDHHVI